MDADLQSSKGPRLWGLCVLSAAFVLWAVVPLPGAVGRPAGAIVAVLAGLWAIADLVRVPVGDGIAAFGGGAGFGLACLVAPVAQREWAVEGAGVLALALAFDVGLLVFGAALGVLLVRRIPRPSWIVWAALVGMAADLFSVLAPAGPTRVMIETRSPVLDVLLVRWPLETYGAAEPVIGVADFAFAAIFHATALRFGFPAGRDLVALGTALVAAVSAAGLLGMALPAVPVMGLAFLAAHRKALWEDIAGRREKV